MFTMKDIDRDGIARVAERARPGPRTLGACMSRSTRRRDPSSDPGVGTPVRGGFKYREAHMIMERSPTHAGTALDLVEINPTLDVATRRPSSRPNWRCRPWASRVLGFPGARPG